MRASASRVAPQPESERGRSGVSSEIKTVLVSDLRSYTRFSQEYGHAAAGRLTAQFAEIAGEAVEGHGGEVVELRGDEVLAVFGSARRAMRAAVELQQVLAREVDDDAAAVGRAGPDAGEVVVVGAGYRGRTLNLAARRLCSKASAGEILATGEVVHPAGQVEGTSFTSLGRLRRVQLY